MTNKPLLAIVFTVFLDLLGYGIVIPVIAPLFLSASTGLFPVGTSEQIRLATMGLLIAMFPLFQFFSAPVLGTLSDRFGRKKPLMLCILGTGFGYLLFGIGILTHQLWLLFLGRIIDGITGGNISIAMSAIADISTSKSKPKNFGLIGMAFGVGFIIGPFLGGKLSDPELVSWFNFATPFWFAAILCLANLFVVARLFPETLKERITRKVSLSTGFTNLYNAFTTPKVRGIFIVSFLVTFAFSLFTQFIQVFLLKEYSWNQSRIGEYFAYIGVCVALAQVLLIGRVSARYRPGQVLSFSIFFLAISLFVTILPTAGWMMYAIAPFIAVFNGLSTPNLTTVISDLAPASSQGEILGINQSVQAMAQAIPPIIGGLIVAQYHTYPIIASGFITLFAWFFFLAHARKTKSY